MDGGQDRTDEERVASVEVGNSEFSLSNSLDRVFVISLLSG